MPKLLPSRTKYRKVFQRPRVAAQLQEVILFPLESLVFNPLHAAE